MKVSYKENATPATSYDNWQHQCRLPRNWQMLIIHGAKCVCGTANQILKEEITIFQRLFGQIRGK